MWQDLYSCTAKEVAQEAGLLSWTGFVTASKLHRFWVVSNSPGSGFLKQDGNVGRRIWWEAVEGDLLPRRLCSRNQRRVWVFKLLLGSERLLTSVFSSRTSLECLPRLRSEIAWLWALSPLLPATWPCLTLCCCCPVTKPCPALLTPWTAACQASWPSLSVRACPGSCPLSRWCHPTISSSAALFSCPQSVSASGSCPLSWLFASDASTGASASFTHL